MAEEENEMLKKARIAILTEACTTPLLAKMAAGVIRYRSAEVCAVIDSEAAGEDLSERLSIPEAKGIPIVSSLRETPEARVFMIGITPAGGALPASWRAPVRQALEAGLEVWSGLHQFLGEDPEFADAARRGRTLIRDLRRYDARPIARAEGLIEESLRVLTVGQDVCVGKMCVALEVERALRERGREAHFIATGQTGIAISGSGAPIDAVPADFIAGAAERLVLEHQAHGRILLGEGQGSLAHPSFSGVTLGLMHGFAPHAMIFCFEADRETTKGLDHVPLASMETLLERYADMAGLRMPAQVIGFGVNSRQLEESKARRLMAELQARFNLPATDVFRFGAGPLADAVERLGQARGLIS
jgi:D-glutamate N-acetyltransferase